MPIGPLAIAGLGAGGNVLGNAVNAYAQGRLNKKERQFSLDMYNRQRSDAVMDFNLQNAYNSPRSQMERLRDAGLNPNLVYGNGAATEASAAVRSSSAPAWNPRSARLGDATVGIGSAIAMYYDLKLKEAQRDNLVQAVTVGQEEAMLKRAQTFATIAGTGKTSAETEEIMIRLRNAQKLSDLSVDAAQANIDARKAETRVLLNRDEREAASNASSLREAVERILTMRKQRAKSDHEMQQIDKHIKSLDKDIELKEADLKLKKEGIQPHDALWQRKLYELLGKWSTDIMQGWGKPID